MKFQGSLLVVRDMRRSLDFYRGLLGLSVAADYGANVALSGGLSLQTAESWSGFIYRPEEEITLPHHAGELYFEEVDMGAFLRRLEQWPEIRYLHPLKEHRWGQRVVRFYDPDGHIVEMGEEMAAVARRFQHSGMSTRQVAARMEAPEEQVAQWLQTEETK